MTEVIYIEVIQASPNRSPKHSREAREKMPLFANHAWQLQPSGT
jgi:hypothetical protein